MTTFMFKTSLPNQKIDLLIIFFSLTCRDVSSHLNPKSAPDDKIQDTPLLTYIHTFCLFSKTPPAELGGNHEAQATSNTPIQGNGGKDVFIFSPIFETVEEAVQVGVGNIFWVTLGI